MIFKVLINNIKDSEQFLKIIEEAFDQKDVLDSLVEAFEIPCYIFVDMLQGVIGGCTKSEWNMLKRNVEVSLYELDILLTHKRQLNLYESDKYICLPKDKISCSVDVSDLTGSIYDRVYGKGHQDTNNGDGTLLFDLESVNFKWVSRVSTKTYNLKDYTVVPNKLPKCVLESLESSQYSWGNGTKSYYESFYAYLLELLGETHSEWDIKEIVHD